MNTNPRRTDVFLQAAACVVLSAQRIGSQPENAFRHFLFLSFLLFLSVFSFLQTFSYYYFSYLLPYLNLSSYSSLPLFLIHTLVKCIFIFNCVFLFPFFRPFPTIYIQNKPMNFIKPQAVGPSHRKIKQQNTR